MGFLSKIVGGIANVATGGLAGAAKKAAGGLLGGKGGLGGMLSKLLGGGGGKGDAGGAEKILGEIKNMLSTLIKKMDDGKGSQGSQSGGGQQHCNPGHGHAQECAVNIPNHR